jgi:putative DNA primase/helicase
VTHPSLEFLRHLDPSPNASFNIECYTDIPSGTSKPKPDPLVKRFPNKSLIEVEALIQELEALNNQGAAIHVARNQFFGQRRLENIERIRGVHADLDDVTPDQIEALAAVLKPSIVVQSSGPRNLHFYWQLNANDELNTTDTKRINQAITAYGADKAAVDVTRLLRLPGFKHMKKKSSGITPVVTAQYSDCKYSAAEIRAAFPTLSSKLSAEKGSDSKLKNTANLSLTSSTKTSPDLLTKIQDQVKATERQLWSGNWQDVGEFGNQTYPSQSEADLSLASRISQVCRSEGVSLEEIPKFVEVIFSNSGLGARDKWQQRNDYRTRTIERAINSLDAQIVVPPPNLLHLDSHGDIRNAKAFAYAAEKKFLYVTTRGKWLQWRDSRWALCEKEEHQAKAKDVCREMLTAAALVFNQNPERGKKLMQDAMAAHTLQRITAMIKLAISEPGIAAVSTELDNDPYLLGVENGVVDLRTGNYFANRPELKITRYCNASFEHNAKSKRWLKFLEEIFEGDLETIKCVQLLLGCTLLGLAREEILIICYGHGANGKSVFSNVIHKIMGGYSITAPPSLLVARRSDDTAVRNDLAALAGSRYVSINETQSGDKLDEQVVKMLAGREPISARFLHQEFFEFQPTFTPWLRTNHKPIITGEDEGIWRRLVLLKFAKQFSVDERDPKLEQKLQEERNGILMWMIGGAVTYLQNGLRYSPRMIQEAAAYRKDSDLLGEFLDIKTDQNPTYKVEQLELYRGYQLWCHDSGVRAMSKKSLTQRLTERGFTPAKSGSQRFYIGLVIKSWQFGSTQGVVDGFESGLGNSIYSNLANKKDPISNISGPTSPISYKSVETTK